MGCLQSFSIPWPKTFQPAYGFATSILKHPKCSHPRAGWWLLFILASKQVLPSPFGICWSKYAYLLIITVQSIIESNSWNSFYTIIGMIVSAEGEKALWHWYKQKLKRTHLLYLQNKETERGKLAKSIFWSAKGLRSTYLLVKICNTEPCLSKAITFFDVV